MRCLSELGSRGCTSHVPPFAKPRTAKPIAPFGRPCGRILTRMRKAAIALALGFLSYKGLQYYVATIEHFAFDYSEANFGRLWPNRLWLLLHIAGGTAALFAGPFQLWSGLRNKHRLIH